MSFHEEFLNRTFYGVGVWSSMGLFVTVGIALSCICRLNSMKPTTFISSEQALYMGFAFWAMEAFTDLLFLQLFSGHDLVFGFAILLYLHSTYAEWAGDDCVSDLFNRWRPEHKQRVAEVQHRIKYGRRATDRR